MSEDTFKLRWNDFETTLSDGLRGLKADNLFCDVTLACENQQVEAHQVVLSAASSFFKNLLISHSYTNTHPILFLKGVKMVDLESVLQYIYHGEANVGVTNLDSFFEVGAELQIKGLTSLPTPLAGRSLLKRNYAVAGPEQGPEQVTTEEELAAKRLRSSDTVKQEPEPAVECKEEREVGQEAVEAAGESSSQLGVIHRSQAGAPDWGGVRARTGAQETAAYDSSVASEMAGLSPSEPTQVLSMLSGYRRELRHSISGTVGGTGTKRSLATRLAFEDTLEGSVLGSPAGRKVPRMEDPFSSQAGLRRLPSDQMLTPITQLQQENKDLKSKVDALETAATVSQSQAASLESRLASCELAAARAKLEWEETREQLEREKRDDKEKLETVQRSLKQVRQRETDRMEEGSRARRISIDRAAELEVKVRALREETMKKEEQLAEVKIALSEKPDCDKMSYNREIKDLRTIIADLENQECIRVAEQQRQAEQLAAGTRAVIHLEKVQSELAVERCRANTLELELRANEDAVQQRHIMRDKLARYNELERENASLVERNKLLVETADNSALLREKVQQLEQDVTRLGGKLKDMARVAGELEVAKQVNSDWSELVREWMTAEDLEALGGGQVGLVAAREAVRGWQERELAYTQQAHSAQNTEKELQNKLATIEDDKAAVESEFGKVKEAQAQQAQLIKKLQRKLFLAATERDSFRGIVDSYDKEFTMTGEQMDKERIAGLEKTLKNFKEMVEVLQEERDHATEEKSTKEIEEFKEKLSVLQEKNDQLEHELERRAIKGDYNTADTKVLHFLNNPLAQAVAGREDRLEELSRENTALKARVTLLEEGQTKDLTLMVGAKVDEESSAQAQQLKADLEKSELKNLRLMEAFKKTSKEFREVVYEITGHKIDVLADYKYKVTPQYVDSAEQCLLFHKAPDGEVQMLESEFSNELGNLMEEHLEGNNSIPMFLSGLIMKMFYRTQPGAEPGLESEDSNDVSMSPAREEDEERSESDEEEDEELSNNSGDDDIIEIDDD